jgi:serine/threonine-protein kinase
MSRVFVADDSSLGRSVVVKVLPAELAGSVSLARFQREISLAARLQHPHIVPLLATGETDGLPYYTMPFVEGESLRAKLARGELPIGETISILRDVARALDFAHSKGVTHRDIKPDNVLLAGTSAVVTDFGVAKALSDATNSGPLTSVGVALGTAGYMAPEQAAADPATDSRADIYSLGAMAYEMLAGHPPFAGRNLQATIAAHATEAPTPLVSLRAAVPPPLAGLVMRCLAKRPADRPQTASEVLKALDSITLSGGSGAVTAPVTTASRIPASVPRSKIFGAIGAVAAIVIAALVLLRLGRSNEATAPGIRSIAIVPFVNQRHDTSFDYLEDGITDRVRDVLNAIPALSVKARSSSQQVKGRPSKEIGKALGVRFVLQGALNRSNSRLHVTTELVRTSDDNALWSWTFDGDPGQLASIQDTIARAVAQKLGASTANNQPASRFRSTGTTSVEAYDLFLQARHLYDRRAFSARGSARLDVRARPRLPGDDVRQSSGGRERVAGLRVFPGSRVGEPGARFGLQRRGGVRRRVIHSRRLHAVRRGAQATGASTGCRLDEHRRAVRVCARSLSGWARRRRAGPGPTRVRAGSALADCQWNSRIHPRDEPRD